MPTATTSAPLVNTISAASGSPKIWLSNLRVREGEGERVGNHHRAGSMLEKMKMDQ